MLCFTDIYLDTQKAADTLNGWTTDDLLRKSFTGFKTSIDGS